MAAILTAEDVVRRIAAECAYVDERGGVGSRLEPAAAIVRQYGDQFRPPRRQRHYRQRNRLPYSDRYRCRLDFFLYLTFATREPLNKRTLQKPSKWLKPYFFAVPSICDLYRILCYSVRAGAKRGR